MSERAPPRSFSSESLVFSVSNLEQKSNAGFQISCDNVPASDVIQMLNSYGVDNVPIHALFSIHYKVMDECFESKNGNIPHHMAILLRKILQMAEGRVSTQLRRLKDKVSLYKAHEEKNQANTRILETLVKGLSEENEIVMNLLQSAKIEKAKIDEQRKLGEQDMRRLMNEKEALLLEILELRQEMERSNIEYKSHCLLLQEKCKATEFELDKNLKDVEFRLLESSKVINDRDMFFETMIQKWRKKDTSFRNFIDVQNNVVQELRIVSESVRGELVQNINNYAEEMRLLGLKLSGLTNAAENYHIVLAENRRLYNEVQDLKGNIRVYCRIRPFLSGQSRKQTTIEYVGDNGELVIVNPLKNGKDNHRLFKFNKVFGPEISQEEVFLDTRPLIRSVLDGYNVCIFAYGQTGSGKTYTMTGPSASSQVDWGVNYRALHDLFNISQSRKASISYEVGVQMVEIYNEQVRDLLSNSASQKRLEVWATTQPNGLAVPDAVMHSVQSTKDVLEVMNVGLTNRAVGSTALNERSSRSHSVLTIHVRGEDLGTSAILRGTLHLVDLAGSERVDRSEASGDRLREAQYINKSLSALGDVIYALAQKSPHVPYRNSKLTQVLQGSLGGQAKTLMFVQLNPDVDSYSETISTLKFAERVSGVELGAARSNKEGRDVIRLMEQVTSLKDTITRKDGEIERLCRRHRSSEKHKISPSSPSPRRLSPQQSSDLSGKKTSAPARKKSSSDPENNSETSDKHSETGSQHSLRNVKHTLQGQECKLSGDDNDQNIDFELLGFGNEESEERLSDISDGVLSMGTETDGSISSIVEFTLFPETVKASDNTEKSAAPSKIPKPPHKQVRSKTRLPLDKSSTRSPSSKTYGSTSVHPPRRWQ